MYKFNNQQINDSFLETLSANREKTVSEALKRLYKGVLELNSMIGLDTSDNSLIGLYEALRKEEIDEIYKAHDNEDPVEFLDGIVDGLVIGSYEYRLKHPRGNVESLALGERDLSSLLLLLSEEDGGEIGNVLDLLEDMFYVLDIDHIQAVETVLESNFSKFPTIDELVLSSMDNGFLSELNGTLMKDFAKTANKEAIKWQIEHIKSKGRYDNITTTFVNDSEGNERIIFWAGIDNEKENHVLSAPKYIKPCTFVEPDFKSCLKV